MNRASLALLCFLTVATLTISSSAAITVDGTVSPADEWDSATYLPDNYTIDYEPADGGLNLDGIYLANGPQGLLIRWQTQSTPVLQQLSNVVNYSLQLDFDGDDMPDYWVTRVPMSGAGIAANQVVLEADPFGMPVRSATLGTLAGGSTVEALMPSVAFFEAGIAPGIYQIQVAVGIDGSGPAEDDYSFWAPYTLVVVPEPATMTLMGAGFAALAGYFRRRR